VVHFRNYGRWTRPEVERGVGHEGEIVSIAWAPDGSTVVTGTNIGTIGVWQPSTHDNQLRHVLGWSGIRAHEQAVVTLAVSADNGILASGALDGRLHLWNVKSGLLLDQLKFTDPILDVAFAVGGRVLVVQSRDYLRFIRVRPFREICSYEFPSFLSPTRGVIAVDSKARIATIAPDKRSVILTYQVDIDSLIEESDLTRRYFVAVGVSVLGESGAGRTNLVRALAGEPFQPQHHAHTFTVHPMRSEVIDRQKGLHEIREVAFWDLPSRIDHALVQRIHAGDGVVALIVLPVTPGTLATANENLERWRLTLKAWQDLGRKSAAEWLCVIAKCDQLLRPPTTEDAELIAKVLAVDKVFLASAKTGDGVDGLREAVMASIAWESAPSFPSIEVLGHLRKFVNELRERHRYLTSVHELYDATHSSEATRSCDSTSEMKANSGTARSCSKCWATCSSLKAATSCYSSRITTEPMRQP
jgi:hypothetical protein